MAFARRGLFHIGLVTTASGNNENSETKQQHNDQIQLLQKFSPVKQWSGATFLFLLFQQDQPLIGTRSIMFIQGMVHQRHPKGNTHFITRDKDYIMRIPGLQCSPQRYNPSTLFITGYGKNIGPTTNRTFDKIPWGHAARRTETFIGRQSLNIVNGAVTLIEGPHIAPIV
jgi:hypothetical protein